VQAHDIQKSAKVGVKRQMVVVVLSLADRN